MNDHRKTWAQEIYLSLVIVASTLAVTYAVTVAGQEKGMTPAEVVHAYMTAQMKADPVLASTLLGPDFEHILSSGGTRKNPVEDSAADAQRDAWVKKRFERTETVARGTPEETVVYSSGTVYGESVDGNSFDENHDGDRFIARNGKIVQQSDWNDSVDAILDRAARSRLFGAFSQMSLTRPEQGHR